MKADYLFFLSLYNFGTYEFYTRENNHKIRANPIVRPIIGSNPRWMVCFTRNLCEA